MGATPTVPEIVRVNLHLESARTALRTWADSQALSPELRDDVLVALFRDWAADEKGLRLSVSRLPADEGFLARWDGANDAPGDKSCAAPTLDQARLCACGVLVRRIAAPSPSARHDSSGH